MHFALGIEVKGGNVEHALKEFESTIGNLRTTGSGERAYCWMVSSESPAVRSKFQVLKAKFEKKFNARLTIRTNQCEHALE